MAVESKLDWGETLTESKIDSQARASWNWSTGAWVGFSSDSYHTFRGAKDRMATQTGTTVASWRMPTMHSAHIRQCTAIEPGEVWYKSSNLQVRKRANSLLPDPDWLPKLSGYAENSALANCVDKSGTEALSRLRDSKMEVGVALAESRKTINHLASTTIRLGTVLRNLRRGRFSAVANDLGLNLSRRATRGLAKNWLEYKYAWTPLYMDVKAAYDAAQTGLEPPLTMRASRDVKCDLGWNLSVYRDEDAGNGFNVCKYTTESLNVEGGCKTILHTRINSAELQRLGQLGLINPLEIVWELVPFSFVFDWIVPVGTFLSACTANIGHSFVSGTRTKYISCDATIDAGEGSRNLIMKNRPRTYPKCRVEVFEYSREVLTDFPEAALYLQTTLSTNKAVTALALLRSLAR